MGAIQSIPYLCAAARANELEDLRGGLTEDAPYQKPFLWPVAFLDVFKNGGFDIVLANPPYVRMEKLSKTDEKTYKETFPEVAGSRAPARDCELNGVTFRRSPFAERDRSIAGSTDWTLPFERRGLTRSVSPDSTEPARRFGPRNRKSVPSVRFRDRFSREDERD